MGRTNRRHTRQIERHRLNKGSEMLCRAADNELQQKAGAMAEGLSKATIENGDVAAAGLLVALAVEAGNEGLEAAVRKTVSLAEKWATEPEVGWMDAGPQLDGGTGPLLLTDGRPSRDDDIEDAEFEMVTESASAAAKE